MKKKAMRSEGDGLEEKSRRDLERNGMKWKRSKFDGSEEGKEEAEKIRRNSWSKGTEEDEVKGGQKNRF